jgi:CheY-like chemotaxis protein
MSKQRILVVDDEPKVAFFFQKNLEMVDDNYIAKAVNSGREALDELQKERYDLLITDWRMPQMDGLELLGHVRRLSPETKTILVTAYGSEAVWEEARRLNTFRALSKPLRIPDLLAAVNDALAESITPTSGLLALTGDRFERLAGRMERLRVDLGARTTLLADLSGRILVYSGSIEALDTASMMGLLGGNMAASSELARHFHYPRPVYLSFFEGPPYDLYAASIGHHFFLTLVFDRHAGSSGTSRIGMVWLYTRRALEELQLLLGQSSNETQAPLADDEFADALRQQLDDIFGDGEVVAESKPAAKAAVQPRQPAAPAPALPLAGRVESILRTFNQQTGIATETRVDSLQQPLAEPTPSLIVKVVSCALKNVYQHAQATIVGVTFNHDEQWLYGCVADNGRGFDPSAPLPAGGNLMALQSLFGKAGGELQVKAQPGVGSSIEFKLPRGKG